MPLDLCVPPRERPPRNDSRASLRWHPTKSDKPRNVPLPRAPSFSLSLTRSLSGGRTERSKKRCGHEEDMHSADPHSLPFSYTIDSSFKRDHVLSPLDDGENRAEFIGRFAVMRQTGPSTKIFLDDRIDNARINVAADR